MNTKCGLRTGRVLVAVFAAAAVLSLGSLARGQQFHGVQIGKSCIPDRCVGDTTDCNIEIGHDDDFGDTIEIQEAFDVVDPKGLDCGTDADALPGCRVPAVGNLPIVQVSGNTTCTIGGSLPCVICEGGVACPRVGGSVISDDAGVVIFKQNEYEIQSGDPDPLEDRANVRIRDLCDAPGTSGCSGVGNLVTFSASSTQLPCVDGNACTQDICVSRTATTPPSCTFDPDCVSPADCTVPNVCLLPTCIDSCCGTTPRCPGEVCCADGTVCNDDDSCTVDSCGPDGCCDTSPLCSPGDICCAPPDGTVCNDNDPCTIDICADPGCCDTTPLCIGSICCADGTSCDDGDPCTIDECDDGCCTNTPICTTNPDCNDFNACTIDICLGTGCCANNPRCPGEVCCADGTVCNDLDPCTNDFCAGDGCCDSTPRCIGSICCAAGASCDDGNVCTNDVCNDGCCTNTPICTSNTQCNDFNDCTTDICVGGCCQNQPFCTVPADCNDGNLCTTDACVAGCCQNPPVECPDDPDPCIFGFCNPANGLCESTGISCDDGNPCTDDSCDPTGRCTYSPSPCCGVECNPVTKAKFDIWNEDEHRFSGTERCIDSWDQTLLSNYTMFGARNHFLRALLQTNRGKARIDGMASTVCDEPGFSNGNSTNGSLFASNHSVDAPLLGIAVRELVFNNGQRALAASELVGMGYEHGAIAYDTVGGPPGSATAPRTADRDGLLAAKSARAVDSAIPTPGGGQSVVAGMVPPILDPAFFRSSVSQKGSLLAFVKIEVKWNAAGVPIQDTIIELTNDYFSPVWVQAYLVHGDACEWVDNAFPLTGDQPAYWSALTGGPFNLSPITVLGEGCDDDDPGNPGGTRSRGYLLVWAVDQFTNREISWNHLTGSATVVNYAATAAWEYAPWAFQAVAEVPLGGTLLFPYGLLSLDDVEYQSAPGQLLMDFFASGASLTNGAQIVGIDTDLTLWAALKDLRQDPGEPFGECFKAAACSPSEPCTIGPECEGACYFTSEGTTRCFIGGTYACETFPSCSSDSDCDPGFACVSDCCPINHCFPLCGAAGARETPVTAGANQGTGGGMNKE